MTRRRFQPDDFELVAETVERDVEIFLKVDKPAREAGGAKGKEGKNYQIFPRISRERQSDSGLRRFPKGLNQAIKSEKPGYRLV